MPVACLTIGYNSGRMSKERFSKLKYKIFGLKEPVISKYPDLLRYDPISKAQELKGFDNILRYVIYLYDPESDLNQEYPDLKDRKAEACALAELNKGDFQSFIDLEPGYVSIIQCLLCEVFHNRKYREWHTAQQELDDFTRMRWEKVNMDKFSAKQRADLNDLCDTLHQKLDRLEEEIFGDHEDVKEVVIADRWSSPERFAAPMLKLINA